MFYNMLGSQMLACWLMSHYIYLLPSNGKE